MLLLFLKLSPSSENYRWLCSCQRTFHTSVVLLFLLLFWKKQNPSSPPQSSTLNSHLFQGEATTLNNTPLKALWTPFHASIPLPSSAAVALLQSAFSVGSYTVLCCTSPCAFHLVYVLSSQSYPTACSLQFLMSPLRSHLGNDVFSKCFCLPPLHTLFSCVIDVQSNFCSCLHIYFSRSSPIWISAWGCQSVFCFPQCIVFYAMYGLSKYFLQELMSSSSIAHYWVPAHCLHYSRLLIPYSKRYVQRIRR